MLTIGAIGYAATGVLYLLLAILLVTTWRGQKIGAFLIAAVAVSVVWSALLTAYIAYGSLDSSLIALFDALRLSAWIAFLVVLVSRIGVIRSLLIASIIIPATIVLVIGFFASGYVPSGIGDSVANKMFLPGSLLLSLLGLVLIEQLYRNSPPESKWSLKPLVLGLGGVFAYDLFLYSQGVLLNALDMTTWIARGLVNILFVPLLAIAARRNADWEMRIFVSRHVVFYSTTLTAVGLYLLLMSLGGYLIVLYGGSWGGLARIVFFVGAFVVLMTLLFSTTLRARLRVFLNKHFFQNKYDYRDEWLRLVATLSDFQGNASREILIKAIAQIVGSPAGAMWLRDDAESDFVPVARMATIDDIPGIDRDEPLVRFIEDNDWLIDFVEYRKDASKYDNVALPKWLAARDLAWLLIPLKSREELLGLILLHKAPGAAPLNYEDRDLLKVVGNHIGVHLAQARADGLLAEARQFEAYNRLTAFLMHDLNNLIAQQSLIVDNAEQHKRNPEFVDDAISTIAGSVKRMKRVMQQLRSGGAESQARPIELRFVASAAVDRCSDRQPVPRIETNGVSASINAKVDDFIMVLCHLLRNAQDACTKDGEVKLSLQLLDGMAVVSISDNGQGMSPDFVRDRMFRPFDSTKGSQGMGIGAYQAREFARGLGGDLTVMSELSQGTTVSLTLPVVG